MCAADLERLGQARIAITNFHSLQLREAQVASKTTKEILTRGKPSPFVETPDQMVRRVCRGLGSKRQIVVLNDEAHHCYMHRLAGEHGSPSRTREHVDEVRDGRTPYALSARGTPLVPGHRIGTPAS